MGWQNNDYIIIFTFISALIPHPFLKLVPYTEIMSVFFKRFQLINERIPIIWNLIPKVEIIKKEARHELHKCIYYCTLRYKLKIFKTLILHICELVLCHIAWSVIYGAISP